MHTAATADRLGRELRFAVRRLLRSPLFTTATVVTLALAIGANVAIFTVVERVLINPLAFPDSNQLMVLDYGWPSRNIPSGVNTITSRMYVQYLDRARTFDGIVLYERSDLTLTGSGDPERIRAVRATASIASVLRVPPARGRWFTDEENIPGVPPVAVLSHGLWAGRFGREPGIIGRSVTLDGVATTIVGVMPASFSFPDPRTDLWLPLPFTRAAASDSYGFNCVARLRRGATIADVRAEITRLTNDLSRPHPGNGYERLVSTAMTLRDMMVGRVATALWILLAAVGLVLLVACANVANLFLVRSEARQREVAVRRALGAGRGGIAGYFLAESLILSTVGAIVGLALAWGGVRLLVTLGPANLPRLAEIRFDGAIVLFTLALSVLTALVCGAIPLLRLAPLTESLQESGRGNTASRVRHRAKQLLMAGQIALALVLLVASGLMIRSFQKLRATDPGFDAASTLTFRIGLPRSDYPNRGRMAAAHRAVLDQLSALPGVAAVSAASCLPLSERGFCHAGGLFVEGRTLPESAAPPVVALRAVAGDYFRTMGMRLVRGRVIDGRDVDRNEPVAVVNEALVTTAFPGEDPIGRRIRAGLANPNAIVWLTIVGVVSNTPTLSLTELRPVPKAYVPMFAARELGPPPTLMTHVVRTAVPPATVLPAVRAAVAKVDDRLALAEVRTLEEVLDRASAQMAFTMILLAIAAAVALTLGVVGIYGVMSYIVSQRTGEIGVRLALGANPASVVAMIVRQGGGVAAAGITIGLAVAAAGSRLIESLLYGVSPRDPGIFAATTLAVAAVALVACWLPARRAARLSPLDALRTSG